MAADEEDIAGGLFAIEHYVSAKGQDATAAGRASGGGCSNWRSRGVSAEGRAVPDDLV
jgi:hypothetical protein